MLIKNNRRLSTVMTMLLMHLALAVLQADEGFCEPQQQCLTVQILSGTDKEAASRFAEKLLNRGFDASVAAIQEQEKPVYKVRVGSFTDKKSAVQILEALKAQGISGWIAPVPEQPAVTPDAGKAAPEPPGRDMPKQEQRPSTEPGARRQKLFVLVINPVPTLQDREPTDSGTRQTPEPPACRQAEAYKYWSPRDNSIHVATGLELVPGRSRRKLWEIALYPVYFKSVNLMDMSIHLDSAGTSITVLLEGISGPAQAPQAGAVRAFEESLKEKPLRLRYYPDRTDPDETLHGSLFRQDGSSIQSDMLRRGLAACADDTLPLLNLETRLDADGRSEGKELLPAVQKN